MTTTSLDVLMRCLPTSELEGLHLGFVSGWHEPTQTAYVKPSIAWVEPPAGARLPYVDPVRATTILLRHQGLELADAKTCALTHFASLRPSLAVNERVRYLDMFEPNSPEHISGDRWLDHLEAQDCVPQDVLAFLRQTLQACSEYGVFNHPDFPGRRLSLHELPARPPANGMVEFMPGCPWREEHGDYAGTINGCAREDWLNWRNSVRLHAAAIEGRWGAPPLYLANLVNELDDDLMHRFLVLHWCCTCKPGAPYVQFLLEASGIESVDALKVALLDPENYALPYSTHDVFRTMSSSVSQFQYTSPNQKTRYVVIAFEDASCLPEVQNLLRQQVAADVLLVDPGRHISEPWAADYARFVRTLEQNIRWQDSLDIPFQTLARSDKLYVVEGPGSTRVHRNVSAGLALLLGLANVLKVPTRLHLNEGGGLWNFMDLPTYQAASERAEKWLDAEPAYLPTMDEIHVWCDYYASGLWDKRGAMLGYDFKTLPWNLIQRLSAWQWDHDRTNDPPGKMGSDAWWDQHLEQGRALAREVQQAVGSQVRVMVHEASGPTWIGGLDA